MRDYLEELLDAMEEPEEDEYVPAVEWISGVPRVMQEDDGTGNGGPLDSGAEAWSTAAVSGAVSRGGRGGEAASMRQAETQDWSRPGRGGGVGDLLTRELARAGRMDGAGDRAGVSEGTGGDMQRTALARGSILERAFRGRAEVSGSAAALERKLAAGMASPGIVVRTAGGTVNEEQGGGGLGLEELDRRVERDARRYDGGMFLY